MDAWITELDGYIKKMDKRELSAKQIAGHFGISLQVLCQQVLYIYHRPVQEHMLCLKGEKKPSFPFLHTPMERWAYQCKVPDTLDTQSIWVPPIPYDIVNLKETHIKGYKVPYNRLLDMKPEDYPHLEDPYLWPWIKSSYRRYGAFGGWTDPDEETGEMSYFFGHIFYPPENQGENITEIILPEGKYAIYEYENENSRKGEFISGIGYGGPVLRRTTCYCVLADKSFVAFDPGRPCFEGVTPQERLCLYVPIL